MIDSIDLSLFHKILVLAEDKQEISLKDLSIIGVQRQTLGALGRLEGLGYLERTAGASRQEDTLRLSEKGDQVLAEILGLIPQEDYAWDGKWRMILFDIPESQRTMRQFFRLKLLDFGARMFQSSVWLTPSANTVERFSDMVQEQGYESCVHYFEAEARPPDSVDVQALWELPQLLEEYHQLFRVFAKIEPRLAKSDDASFYAKCMIVALALVNKKDPHLPEAMMPNHWVRKEVLDWHTKLRTYCV